MRAATSSASRGAAKTAPVAPEAARGVMVATFHAHVSVPAIESAVRIGSVFEPARFLDWLRDLEPWDRYSRILVVVDDLSWSWEERRRGHG